MRNRPLWRCPQCQRSFANRNQSHACGRHDLEHHFLNKSSQIKALYERFLSMVLSVGPVKVIPEKPRIAFQARMSFAQVTPRRQWLDGHVVLARRRQDPRFLRIDTISARNHVHCFRISTIEEIDDTVRSWLTEAYGVGQQEHLKRKS